MKAILRKDVKKLLSQCSKEHILARSQDLFVKLLSLDEFTNSQSLSVYLNMPNEVITSDIVSNAFRNNRKLYIPKIVGKRSEDMVMFEVQSESQLDEFPRNSWGIPEPSKEQVQSSSDGTYYGNIDCVIVPGAAFDSSCGRLGHGKGYYDCFIRRTLYSRGLSEDNGLTPGSDAVVPRLPEVGKRPVLIGLALDEQILEHIPMEDHDFYMDYVVTPTRIFKRQ